MNLTYEVREGLVKHDTDYDTVDAAGYEPDKAGTLECQIANLADEIAYNTSDLDDGLRSGILEPEEVSKLEIWRAVTASLGADPNARIDARTRRRVIRRLIGLEITDAITTTADNLAAIGARSPADIRSAGRNVAAFSPEMFALNRELKDY